MARVRTVPAPVRSRLFANRVTGWQSDARVVTLTRQINNLQRQTAIQVVDAVVAMGRRIAEVRSRLPHGQWQRWVESAVPLTARTMSNYLALAAWADARPAEVERLAYLGPTKLYLLAGLPVRERRALTSARAIALPDGREKQIGLMTVVELAEVIAGARGLAIAPVRPPIGRVLERMRHRIAGLEAMALELARRRDEVGQEEALEIRNELVELVDAIDGAFGL